MAGINRRLSLRQLITNSPFPNIEIPKRMIWTASSIKQFRKCKRKWFWKYIMRLHPRFTDYNLSIGTAFHNSLGEWYRGKRASMNKVMEPFAKNLEATTESSAMHYDQDDVDKMHVMVQTFRGMMMGYEAIYSQDRNNWDILRESIEAKFQVSMGDFDYAGKIDLLFSERGYKEYVFTEHKTSSSFGASYIDRLPLDTQVRGYIWGCENGLKVKVKRVLYDVVRKCKLRRKSNESLHDFTARIAEDYMSRPDFYFYREDLIFDKNDIAAFEHEIRLTHQEYMNILKDTSYNNRFDPRFWCPNDAMCDEYFKSCEYLTLCTTGLDKGTARMYVQGESLHEELAN